MAIRDLKLRVSERVVAAGHCLVRHLIKLMATPSWRIRAGVCLVTMIWSPPLCVSEAMQNGSAAPAGPLAVPPRQWAVQTATNEVAVLEHTNSYLRYRMHVVDQKGDQTRDVIESKDGTVARLILRDGRPLTADEDAAEKDRLHEMLASPSEFEKHQKNEASGKKLAADMIRQMPDAMLYTYTPGQPQTGTPSQPQSGRTASAGEVVLDYHPNPNWTPPSTMAEALTGLEGRMWIDVKTRQMVRTEGHVFKPVNFGWGMLAHIYPGGNLVLEQTNAGGQRWIYTNFEQELSVRALMVKTLRVRTHVEASGFQVLPGPISYQDAVKQLLSTPLPSH